MARWASARERTGCRSPLADVCAQDVHRLAVSIQRRRDVLGRTRLGALAAAPQDVRPCPELGRQIDVAQDLGQGVPAHVTVVGGEPAVLEHRVREQVRGGHLDAQAGRRPRPCRTGRASPGESSRPEPGRRRGRSRRRLRARPAAPRPRPGPVVPRTGPPNTSMPRQPTVHSPKLNRSFFVGTKLVMRPSPSTRCPSQRSAPLRRARAGPARPSANDGSGSRSSAIAVTRSTAWWVKLCS